ncbi:ACT domain-containing protein ACR2-like [Pyrus communis]|uniref:ACT domain-containing protein ACR2-like n=1 Tax=Pyrus communis TaxID=23211 RepID=UPI0035C18CBF
MANVILSDNEPAGSVLGDLALADLQCNKVEGHAWSHNARLACVAQVSDQSTDSTIDGSHHLATVEDHLITVLRATTALSPFGKSARIGPRLMFDTVCTLIDMQYVSFHASASAQEGYAFQ